MPNALHPHLTPKTIMYLTAWVLEIFSQTNMSNPSQEYYDCYYLFSKLKLNKFKKRKWRTKTYLKQAFGGQLDGANDMGLLLIQNLESPLMYTFRSRVSKFTLVLDPLLLFLPWIWVHQIVLTLWPSHLNTRRCSFPFVGPFTHQLFWRI